MKIYSVRVTTTRNTFFEWEIEETTAYRALARIVPRIKGLDVAQVKLIEQES